jgi:peptide/nickel transport system substrate-binding protein
VSRDYRTFTFTLRRTFRFSDGTQVRADAFARAITRTLAPGVKSPWAAYTRDIAQVAASGSTLTVRLKRPTPDFIARTVFLCAVPPQLPAEPEGVGAYPAAGPYYVAKYTPGEEVVIRRNRFYGGTRPQRVEGFDVDLRLTTFEEVLDRIESGRADWGWALASAYFDPTRRLAAKYGLNRSRFFVTPGYEFRGYAFNTRSALFRDNPRLRRAVNFAIDRRALARVFGGPAAVQLTDQYLPPRMPGFSDARVYPLGAPNVAQARALARGQTRGGKGILYAPDRPEMLAAAQSIKGDLARIGLDFQVKGIPLQAYFGRLGARGPYDLGFNPWVADYNDPFAVLNVLFDGRFIGATNWSRLNSPLYNRLLRRAALEQGGARYRAYGKLDAQLARDAAPMVAVGYMNEPTLVSKRLGCVSRPFDLAASCLK